MGYRIFFGKYWNHVSNQNFWKSTKELFFYFVTCLVFKSFVRETAYFHEPIAYCQYHSKSRVLIVSRCCIGRLAIVSYKVHMLGISIFFQKILKSCFKWKLLRINQRTFFLIFLHVWYLSVSYERLHTFMNLLHIASIIRSHEYW